MVILGKKHKWIAEIRQLIYSFIATLKWEFLVNWIKIAKFKQGVSLTYIG